MSGMSSLAYIGHLDYAAPEWIASDEKYGGSDIATAISLKLQLAKAFLHKPWDYDMWAFAVVALQIATSSTMPYLIDLPQLRNQIVTWSFDKVRSALSKHAKETGGSTLAGNVAFVNLLSQLMHVQKSLSGTGFLLPNQEWPLAEDDSNIPDALKLSLGKPTSEIKKLWKSMPINFTSGEIVDVHETFVYYDDTFATSYIYRMRSSQCNCNCKIALIMNAWNPCRKRADPATPPCECTVFSDDMQVTITHVSRPRPSEVLLKLAKIRDQYW